MRNRKKILIFTLSHDFNLFFLHSISFSIFPLVTYSSKQTLNLVMRLTRLSSCSTSRIKKSYIQIKVGAIGAFVHSQSCTYQDFPIPPPSIGIIFNFSMVLHPLFNWFLTMKKSFWNHNHCIHNTPPFSHPKDSHHNERHTIHLNAQEVYYIVWLEYKKPRVLDYFRFDLKQIDRCLIFPEKGI